MIHVFYNEGTCNITMEGNRAQLLAESVALMHSIYDAIASRDEDMAGELKDFLTEHIDVLFMSDEEVDETLSKLVESKRKDAESKIKEISDILDELLEKIGKDKS